MSLFHKDTHIENKPTPKPADTEAAEMQLENSSPMTTEERARVWWQNHHGESMPDEMVRWMKHLTRTEARRQTIAASLLSPQQMARTEDMIRLAESKLRNIESSLQQVRGQREWLKRYNEKKNELTEHQNRLHELNKQLAIIADEEKDLERFETFETIQGTFQRMMLFEEQARSNKQSQSELARQVEEAQKTNEDRQKQLKPLTDASEEAANQMIGMRDRIIEASHILGERSILDIDKENTSQLDTSINQQRLMLDKEIKELEAQIAAVSEIATQQKAQRQTMEPHQALVEHGEAVLLQLKNLAELEVKTRQTAAEQAEELHNQQEENDMLSRVFADYQRVEADIETLKAELEIHRQQNLGQSTQSLQKRAAELNSRRQMLLAAQSLWNRIRMGYQLIEEKTRDVNRLRLDLDNLRLNIENLENKIEHLRQLCHEKEYTLTLSKSQNVIQLRSDLREGVSCTVCGATHHPYHGDTMQEQNKLISELRTDFEQIRHELAGQEPQLQQMRNQLASTTARREVEEEELSRLRQRQIEDVKEWSVFASLDRTFDECSPSTNLDARSSMIRQLIENTAHDAEDAQSELDRFNYHQTRINELNEALNRKAQQRNDLTIRLNEVNTGCQVLARMVELTRQRHSRLQNQYTQLYEQLNKRITLNDWYANWQSNHESTYLRIEQMMERWTELNQEIAELSNQEESLRAKLQEKREQNDYLENLSTQLREAINRHEKIYKEGEKRYIDMLGDQSVADHFDSVYQPLLQAHEKETKHRDELCLSSTQLASLLGHQQEIMALGEAFDKELVEIKSKIDVWIRRFNASNPPVQYGELQQALDAEKDWNAIRQRIRDTRIKAMLGQARVDALRSAIVALQGDACRLSDADDDGALDALVLQQQQLEHQRQEVIVQLAEQHIALRKHEACQKQIREEEESIYEMTSKA